MTLDWPRAGGISALVIDEAQSLPFELLEEVRLLSNLETADEKMLPTVLVGQPELADRLNDPSLRQLKQRIALRCSLEPLDLREAAAYIAKRDSHCRRRQCARLFTRDAVVADLPALARHAAHDQRDLRQRAGHRLRHGPAAGRPRHR